jgi:hypothetical protein
MRDHNNLGNKSNNVTIVNSGRKPRKAHKSKFLAPKRKPTKIEERGMIGKAVEVLIISCMNNHVYKFNNQLRIHSRGGPIGLGLTGEIADCFMIKWDKQFLQKCENIGIKVTMYSRFKDDIFISALDLEKGTRLVDGKLIVDSEKKEQDEDKSDDDITMEIIRQVAELNVQLRLSKINLNFSFPYFEAKVKLDLMADVLILCIKMLELLQCLCSMKDLVIFLI